MSASVPVGGTPTPPVPETLYPLLPAPYRRRDLLQGEPLRALLGVLEAELTAVRGDVEALYDNWFIETCDDWVVPYIGALVGATEVAAASQGGGSPRAYVANTVAHRRRKGTAAALAALAQDLTGWPAQAVELFQRVGLTQPINLPRPAAVRTPSLRLGNALGLLGGPFDPACYSVDLRGKYNLPGVGIYLWRLLADPITRTQSAAPATAPQGCYTFDPLGLNAQLFNPDRVLSGVSTVVSEGTRPGPLRARALSDELEALRAALATAEPAPPSQYFDVQPSFQIYLPGATTPVPPAQILIAGLGGWQLPPASKLYGAKSMPIAAAVDPVLGRIAFPQGSAPASAPLVSYYRGLAGAMGGGGYARSQVLAQGTPTQAVTASAASWVPSTLGAVLEIGDSLAYQPPPITLPAGANVEIFAVVGQRPVLSPAGGTWNITLGNGASLTLNGLLVSGNLSITTSGPATLTLVDCTAAPHHGVIGQGALTLVVTRAVTGALSLDPVLSALTVTDSILGGAVTAGSATLSGATVLGAAAFARVGATNALFDGPVTSSAVDPAHLGAVACFVPPGSSVPQTSCQPALALTAASSAAARVAPSFMSLCFGDPGYARLSTSCAPEILQGADDGGELGAFHTLGAPQRLAQLESSLANYLRFGLWAEIYFVT